MVKPIKILLPNLFLLLCLNRNSILNLECIFTVLKILCRQNYLPFCVYEFLELFILKEN